MADSKQPRSKPKTKAEKQRKTAKVMREFKRGKLKSGGSGVTVTDREQAIAIAMSESGQSGQSRRRGRVPVINGNGAGARGSKRG